LSLRSWHLSLQASDYTPEASLTICEQRNIPDLADEMNCAFRAFDVS
jgi:hypothetical protein